MSDRKLNIALMTHTFDNRRGMGTATVARKATEQLIASGEFNVTLVHFDTTDDPIYKTTREILVPFLPKLPFGTRFLRFLLFCYTYRNEKFDVVHWFQPRLYPFFWLFPARHTVVTAHGGGDVLAPHKFSLSRQMYISVLRLFKRKVDVVIASSQFGKREIIEAYGTASEKTPVIYLGGAEEFHKVEKEKALEVVRRYGVTEPYILTVSRLVPHKNVEGLVKAYTHARNKGLTQKLVIVGGNGGWKEKVEEEIKRSPFAADISHIEYVATEDLNSMYSAADLFVFPSFNEGWGMPVLEAMKAGVPVVSSNVTALPEAAGDAGMLVDPRDTEAMGEAIYSVLNDSALREGMVRKGFIHAGKFTWSRMAEDIAHLYKTITV